MNRSYLKICGAGTFALVVVAGVASSLGAQKAVGYLAKIGPAPLRMQSARPAAQIAILPPLAMTDPVAPVADDVAVPPTETITYHAESPAPVAQLPVQIVIPPAPWLLHESSGAPPAEPAPKTAVSATNSPLPAPTAGDLLPITPGMLIEYFRPQSQTNATGETEASPDNSSPVHAAEPTFKMP